jgi:hypothetical protein
MLCHIVTRSRQLLVGVRFARQVLQRCRIVRRPSAWTQFPLISSGTGMAEDHVAVITLKVAGGEPHCDRRGFL